MDDLADDDVHQKLNKEISELEMYIEVLNQYTNHVLPSIGISELSSCLMKWIIIFYQLLDKYLKVKFGQIGRTWLFPNDQNEVSTMDPVWFIVDDPNDLDQAVKHFIPYNGWDDENTPCWMYSKEYEMIKQK